MSEYRICVPLLRSFYKTSDIFSIVMIKFLVDPLIKIIHVTMKVTCSNFHVKSRNHMKVLTRVIYVFTLTQF